MIAFLVFPPGIVASAGIEPASILLKEMDDRLYQSFLPAPHFHKSNHSVIVLAERFSVSVLERGTHSTFGFFQSCQTVYIRQPRN